MVGIMSRVSRTFGPFLKYGTSNFDTFYTDSPAIVEASPIYQEMEISMRIWGTRTGVTGLGVGVTQTIDQTEVLTLTRGAISIYPTGAPPSIGYEFQPGEMFYGQMLYGVATDEYLLSAYNVGVVSVGQLSGLAFQASLHETEFNYTGVSQTPPFDGFRYASLPDPKRQQLVIVWGEDRDFTFANTPSVPTPTETVTYFMYPPRWGGLSSVAAGQRFTRAGWGYSAAECIDTSGWSATKWRDYRGTYAMPAQSMVVSPYTSGDMQRQITVTLS